MYIPIGKITEQSSGAAHILAIVAFDTLANRTRIISSQGIKDLVDEGQQIVGIKFNIDFDAGISIVKSPGLFKYLPECDGRGLPEDDSNTWYLLGRYIEKPIRKYYIICDYYGNTELKTRDQVLEFLSTQKVIGLETSSKGQLRTLITTELSLSDIISMGYEKHDKVWLKQSNNQLDNQELDKMHNAVDNI